MGRTDNCGILVSEKLQETKNSKMRWPTSPSPFKQTSKLKQNWYSAEIPKNRKSPRSNLGATYAMFLSLNVLSFNFAFSH